MEIVIGGGDNGQFYSVLTRHNGKELIWSTVTYIKVKFFEQPRLFRELNEFWAKLPEESQQEIFDAYEVIHQTLSKVENHRDHRKVVCTEVAKIYKHYTAEDVHGILCNLDIKYPTTMAADSVLDQSAASNDNASVGTSRFGDLPMAAAGINALMSTNGVIPGDRTYRRSDYFRLLHLALRLRPMVPIFGHYVKIVVNYSGTQYKEYSAVELLEQTDVLDCPAMDKLIDYMEVSLSGFPHIRSGIVKGMGSNETPRWLACRALFRRVAVGEMYYGDNISSIVTNVFNFVKSQLDSMPRNFGGNVKDKTRTTEGTANSEDKLSQLESYKIRQQLADGDKVLINVYGRDPVSIAKRVDSTIDEATILRFANLNGDRVNQPIHKHQLILSRWVLSPVMGPRYIDVMSRESALLCIGAAQALLYHWGFINIAALLSCVEQDDPNVAPMGALWSRDSISKEVMTQLRETYPYSRKPTKRDQTPDDQNVGVIGIELLSAAIYSTDWVLKEPESLIEEAQLATGNVVLIPPNLKDQLAEILIKVAVL